MVTKLKPDATTWVARDQEGGMVAIKVADMESTHIVRWIRLFRQKMRERAGNADLMDHQLDRLLQISMVTAPAIFGEAKKRGLYAGSIAAYQGPMVMQSMQSPLPLPPPVAPVKPVEVKPGHRRIRLDDD